jgi:glycosyltransferase involved in cell wall biosynthesis
VSGIPELIEENVNGAFVDPDDDVNLARRIVELARDPELRARLGAAGEHRVRAQFDHRNTIGDLLSLVRGTLAGLAGKPGGKSVENQ